MPRRISILAIGYLLSETIPEENMIVKEDTLNRWIENIVSLGINKLAVVCMRRCVLTRSRPNAKSKIGGRPPFFKRAYVNDIVAKDWKTIAVPAQLASHMPYHHQLNASLKQMDKL